MKTSLLGSAILLAVFVAVLGIGIYFYLARVSHIDVI